MSVAASSTTAGRRWLFGPVSDLLLGCGVAYLGVFVLLLVAAERVESAIPIWTFLIISLFVSGPHYGATLLRVYERRQDRRAYAVFAIHVTAVLWALFAVSVHNSVLGSLLFTLYYTWSPWHYSGQNYGLSVMFLGRRGVATSPLAKRLLYASFLLSYAIIFVTLHGGGHSEGYAPAPLVAGSYQFLRIGFPGGLAYDLYAILAALYVSAVVGAVALLLRQGSLRDLAPMLVLMLSQALWFVVPPLGRVSGLFPEVAVFASERSAEYLALWIASAHAVQYLWVTTFYAARNQGYAGRTRYLGKALLAGTAIWGVPALLFAPGLLGRAPYNLGLFMMVAATVNLHHFILDGAIWKLRDSRIAKVLVGGEARPGAAPIEPAPRRSFAAPLVFASGLACLVIFVLGDLENQYGVVRASERGDYRRVEQAVRRLGWIGRDSPKYHHQLALMAQQRGDLATAEREFQTALSLYETKNAWNNLGSLYLSQARWSEALRAYERALALDAQLLPSLDGAARAALELGDRERAVALLARATRLAPGDPALRQRLVDARTAPPASTP